MWKFGLLGRDFGYEKFYLYPNRHQCWISAESGEREHPHFGVVAEICNVLVARQGEAQKTVNERLRGLRNGDAAGSNMEISYDMVTRTPRGLAGLHEVLLEVDM